MEDRGAADEPRIIDPGRAPTDRVFHGFVRSIAVLVLVIFGSIGVFLGYQSIPTFRRYGLRFLTEADWNPERNHIGISSTITGVCAGDANFAGSTSAPLTQTVQTAVVPGSPTNLNATAGDRQVGLSWTAPTSNGGSPITGYNVYVGTSPGGESATPANPTPVSGTSNTVGGLTNGSQYYFVVKAVNAVGPSAPSNEASAIPRRCPAIGWTGPTAVCSPSAPRASLVPSAART